MTPAVVARNVRIMRNSSREGRQILLLEVLAASSIFCLVAIVLYMVFQYKPV